MKTLLIITLLFILMTPAPSSAKAVNCPITDASGQTLTGGAWVASDRLRCTYGKPYNLKFLCSTHYGAFAYKARFEAGSLVCFYRQTN